MNNRSSREVSLPGVKLFLEEQGQGQAVLLLHGLGSTGADWSRLAPRLAPSHRVLVPDIRGHGRSEKPAGAYGVPLFARDIAALCDSMQLKALHVVGLSMGGMIAFQLAVERPDLVGSLTIVNSGPDMRPRGLKMRLALWMRLLIIRLLGPRALAERLGKILFPSPDQAELKREAVERLGANDRDVYFRATRGLIGWSVADRLGEISCPVLVVASEHDYTPVSIKRAYAAKIKGARVEVLQGSRHFAPADAPDALYAVVSQFLQQVVGGPRAAVG
jgi:pimeloyl-ACP methyl ester carboxylesterase